MPQVGVDSVFVQSVSPDRTPGGSVRHVYFQQTLHREDGSCDCVVRETLSADHYGVQKGGSCDRTTVPVLASITSISNFEHVFIRG